MDRPSEYLKELILTSILCLLLLSGCAIAERSPCLHNELPSECRHRFDWECCYRSGLAYARGGCPDKAISEFHSAMAQNPKDKWRTRTYGMHFLDYFPHRELGIIYLNQGRIREAMDELSQSLASADSARATYYLNEARRKWLEETGLDKTPPSISFIGRVDDENTLIYTSQSTYVIEGEARDDYFVSGISIHGELLFIELAQPVIPFKKEVALSPGENIICCEVSDLSGNRAVKHLRVILDQQGPIVMFAPLSHKDIALESEDPMATLRGIAYDSSGVEKLIIADEELPITHDENIWEFEKKVPLYSQVTFCVWDRAGNSTKGTLGSPWGPPQDVSSPVPSRQIKVCSSRILPLLAKGDMDGPVIHLEPCPSIVFEPFVVVTGWVESRREILNVWINEESILSKDESEALIPRFRRIFHKYRSYIYGDTIRFSFTRTIPLKEEGKNPITIYAQDSRKTSPPLKTSVEYRISEIQRIGRRWSMAILPFDIVTEGDVPIFAPPAQGSIAYITEKLQASFFDTGRFRILERERIDAVMHELNLSYGCAIDPNTALKIGKGIGADVLLAGSFYEHWEGQNRCLEIYARLIDVETREILGIENIYNHWKEPEDIDFLSKGLSQRFLEEFPLTQGEIVELYDKTFLTDLGTKDQIKRGMRLWVYRPKEGEQKIPETMLAGDAEIIGEGRIEEVSGEYSLVLPTQKKLLSRFRVGDRVITK
ncbi:MAG: CsgG/HfaB family protein [bacterium]